MTISVGFGADDYFRGRLADLRLYQRTLNLNEIRRLANQGK